MTQIFMAPAAVTTNKEHKVGPDRLADYESLCRSTVSGTKSYVRAPAYVYMCVRVACHCANLSTQ